MNYYPGYQADNRTINTSNNIVLTKIYCEKIQAKDLALLPIERKQPQIDKQIKIPAYVRKKARSDNERTLVSICDKNSAAAKSNRPPLPKAQNTAQRDSEPSVLFSLPFSLSKVGKMLSVFGSFKRQISKTGKLNKKKGLKKG